MKKEPFAFISKGFFLYYFLLKDKTNKFNKILYHLLNINTLSGTNAKREPLEMD